MTPQEWKAEWKRLDQFRVSAEAERSEIEAEWFSQLRHHHIDAVSHGITQLIGHAKDTFLPGLGLLKDFIQQRIDRYERTPGKCHRCHGATWIEAPATKSNGIIYERLTRCPACGIPAPQMSERHREEPLTDLERHEYRAGRYGRDLMPPGLDAKHPDKPGNPEIKAAMEALRKKLFGVQTESA
jgi:hypothetical protein